MASGLNGYTYDCTQTGITKIQWENESPRELFKKWQQEARSYLPMPDAFCLSTVSRNSDVSSRTLILRKEESQGYVFMTDSRGRKCQDLSENPHAAMIFFWAYINNEKALVNRQVRITGFVTELNRTEYTDLYEREPLFCKIRSHICNQGEEVEWMKQKEMHDRLLKEIKEGKKLEMPSHIAIYRLQPDILEFYEAVGNTIGDRLNFAWSEKSGSWVVKRLAA